MDKGPHDFLRMVPTIDDAVYTEALQAMDINEGCCRIGEPRQERQKLRGFQIEFEISQLNLRAV